MAHGVCGTELQNCNSVAMTVGLARKRKREQVTEHCLMRSVVAFIAHRIFFG